MVMVWTSFILLTFLFLEALAWLRQSSSQGCPRVRPQTSDYLHYLMQRCSPGSELQAAYKQQSPSSSGYYHMPHMPFGFGRRLSDEETDFQPAQDQDVADQCISVPPCDRKAKYRTFNGSCNNFNFPMWGVAGSALVRLVPAHYQDGIKTVRRGATGKELPPPRELRTSLMPDKDIPDHIHMLNVMQWGQLVAHDTSHIVQKDSDSADGGLECCSGKSQSLPKACLPISVPQKDPFYSQFNKTCINFVRSMTTSDLGCRLDPNQQIAAVTHFVDASLVYGNDDKTANFLRTFSDGKLKVQVSSDGRIFPPNTENAAKDCDNQGKENVCYLAGDDRVNQNTGITVLQVVLLREHNRICDELRKLNPHWRDETLYQESRRIVVAEVQRITYTAFLPIIIGKDQLKKFTMLDGDKDEPLSVNDYDPFLNPSTLNSFTSAAYRSFHSMVPREMVLFDDDQQILDTLLLDNFFFRPTVIQEPGMLDNLLRGLATQPAQSMDQFISIAIENLLFKSTKPFGTDLESIDIQRGRDHGLPTYSAFRAACGLSQPKDWQDLCSIMPQEAIDKLSSLYNHVSDIDLYIGGIMETLVNDTLVGPTFRCINTEQFRRWRNGDRFYYDFGNQAGSFTLEQVKEIRKVSLAELFCRNGDKISRMQLDVFKKISDKNPLKSCSEIVKMNLDPWKES